MSFVTSHEKLFRSHVKHAFRTYFQWDSCQALYHCIVTGSGFYPENNRPDVLMLFSVCVFSMIAGSVVFDVRHKRNSVR